MFLSHGLIRLAAGVEGKLSRTIYLAPLHLENKSLILQVHSTYFNYMYLNVDMYQL